MLTKLPFSSTCLRKNNIVDGEEAGRPSELKQLQYLNIVCKLRWGLANLMGQIFFLN